jgi:predicted dehydrogenase
MIKAALIGTGQIARQHLSCLSELPEVDVLGVCDLSPSLAESTAERFGIPAWYTDHRRLLDEVRPDVVHVTTPPISHFPLAMAALDAGAHVIVEKPATVTRAELETLIDHASQRGRVLVEDYNYIFNDAPRKILALMDSGDFGSVIHVDILICIDILAPGSTFADPNAPHPCLSMVGGVIADFLPHLASLAHLFIGPHRSARTLWSKRGTRPSLLLSDEFRALVDADRGSALLGFSANTQPDAFWLRVYGEKMQAVANLFETRSRHRRLEAAPTSVQRPARGPRRAPRRVGRPEAQAQRRSWRL